ncbi:MAG: hypothetical protein JW973_16150 [Bacteroidales bacterium]|nr:hypothetical protein [Bacteroidales bacterium]
MFKVNVVLLFLFFHAVVLPQYITTDTVYIGFDPDTLIPVNYKVLSVTDKRTVHPNLVSYSQKKRLLVIPVDQELLTKESLAELIMKGFQKASGQRDTLVLNINYFMIDRYKGHLSNPYLLKADIPVFKLENYDTLPVGTLIYNYKYPVPRKKSKNPQVCQTLLEKWYMEFKLDLMATTGYIHNESPAPENLIIKTLKRSEFLNATVAGTIGLNFWQVEGELYFTRPETEKRHWFLGNIVRYQHTSDFEMIGFGKKSEHFASRVNERWVFEITSNLLAGYMKWKEIRDIKLYHLIQVSLSSAQTISFNRTNENGLQFKGGLFENVYYVIGMNPKIQAGIYLNIGYKF